MLILAALAAISTSGCAHSSQPAEPTFRVVEGATYIPVTPAEAEYQKEAATLLLPPGYSWPQHSLPASESGSPEWYEVGYGRQAADSYWFCSWASTALKTADPQLRQRAVGTLGDIFHLYYYTHALVTSSQPLLQREVTNAQHGDFIALRTDVQLNC